MTKKNPARTSRGQAMAHPHQHGKGHCLDVLRQLSAYIDDELPEDICGELRRHLGACPNCEVFVASLRQTVTLCRHSQTPPLSARDRAEIRRGILQASKTGSRR
ncbi:MAG TPA: zf-HC2 domain-containing protein [Nitrospira sp.]|nr:zf-HC2 domain-containing protein [Nitrospira sp.]